MIIQAKTTKITMILVVFAFKRMVLTAVLILLTAGRMLSAVIFIQTAFEQMLLAAGIMLFAAV
ncbi:MAG TPA: hypothetical protein DIT64_11630 [Verrucomicrobiales bacterium]|nr:hypothetical protein [Verrucomicrobiales bacterium]